ncbi:hypothetical protein [Rhodopseudomonas palustris]|uniref:hypothetical protein n=1 Tax=Rhodopseudomonas palustris TaxID=1076 RepID=UPI0012ED5A7A|nr:hypothetical protein [Rhodopseudomonas palustris]
MRQQNPAITHTASHARTWPSLLLNADLIVLGAAIGLIAAVAFGTPHLRLL